VGRGFWYAVFAAGFSAIVSTAAHADSEGFRDNWRGNLSAELKAVGLEAGISIIPLPVVYPAISQQFTSKWQGSDTFKKLCSKATQGVAGLTSCSVPSVGELRARLVGQNLDLKYVLAGINLRGKVNVPDPLPGALDIVIRASFDIEIRAQASFDTSVDGKIIPPGVEQATVATALDSGAPYLLKPIHGGAIQARAINQRVTAESPLIDVANFFGRDLRKEISDRINRFINDQNAPNIEDFDFSELNRALHRGANQLATMIQTVHPGLGFQSREFPIVAFIDGDRLVLQYQRMGTPPQVLPNCACTPKCGSEVSCHCAGAGIIQENDHVFLQALRQGAWVPAGDDATDFVDGNAFGARDGQLLTYRLCRANKNGSSCTTPINVVYQDFGACTHGGGGGSAPSGPQCGGAFNPKPCTHPNPLK